LKVQLTQNLPQAFEETWGRSIRHWPQNCQKNWAAVMAHICKWHNFNLQHVFYIYQLTNIQAVLCTLTLASWFSRNFRIEFHLSKIWFQDSSPHLGGGF
jgi:hypothetical protein